MHPAFAPHPDIFNFPYILLLQRENFWEFNEKWLKMLVYSLGVEQA